MGEGSDLLCTTLQWNRNKHDKKGTYTEVPGKQQRREIAGKELDSGGGRLHESLATCQS